MVIVYWQCLAERSESHAALVLQDSSQIPFRERPGALDAALLCRFSREVAFSLGVPLANDSGNLHAGELKLEGVLDGYTCFRNEGRDGRGGS